MSNWTNLFTFWFLVGIVLQISSTKAYQVRQDGDADSDYEEEEETPNKNQAGVLDIIGGAFSGDLNKILSGSFSFTDKEIGDKLLPSITGVKPKAKPGSGGTVTKTNEKVVEEEDAED